MKTCTRCNIEKDDSFFGRHTEKRESKLKGKPPYEYVNSQCKKCVADTQKIYRNKIKDTPDFKKKHAELAKKRYWKHRDECLVDLKNYRESNEAKAVRKKYEDEHRETLRKQASERNKKYSECLTPMYARSRICFEMNKQGNRISAKEIPTELVEIKIKQLKSWRTLRKLKD